MKRWNYSITGNSQWISFDFGMVEAETSEKALQKAIRELDYNYGKANEALKHCDNTANWSLEYNEDSVEITEVKK